MRAPEIPENELARLCALHRRSLLDTAPEERFDRLTRLAHQVFDIPIALVSLVDSERQWFKSRQGLDACETGRDISFCGHAILGGDIFEVTDARLDPRFADNPLVSGPPHIRFYAGAPLTTSDGYRVGTLCIIGVQPRQLSTRERRILLDLAACVEEEINQAELEIKSAALKQAQLLGNAIARAQSSFIRESDRRKAFDELLTDILALTASEYGFIGEVLHTKQATPYLKTCAARAPAGMAFSHLDSLFGPALTSGQPLVVDAPCTPATHDGLAEPYPASYALLGIPVLQGDESVALVGLAHRPDDADRSRAEFIQPLLSTLGQLVAAARIQQQHHQDRRELARFKNTLDRTLDCVFMFDADSLGFFYANEGGMRQVGYSLAELATMHAYDIKPDISESQFRALVSPLIARERDSLTFETEHEHKLGHRIPVEIFLQHIAPPDEPARFVAIVRDLTERRRVDRMKREFVSTVSHELRTPLTSITGALGLLAGGAVGPLPEPVQDMVGIAHQNSQRLACLIDDLLDMEKLLAGRMQFDIQSQALGPLLDQAILAIAPYAAQQRVRLARLGNSDGIRVRVDPLRLQQIMANLLSNAAKFSAEGGTVEIAVSRQNATAARIEVKDSGAGIPLEFRDRIFEKFAQADSSDSRQKGGTGLGLAITRELVERMGGRIGFESMENAGCTFFFTLPMLRISQTARTPKNPVKTA